MPDRVAQMQTNKIRGLHCVSLPRIAWFCAKLELKIRCPKGRAGSSPALGTSEKNEVTDLRSNEDYCGVGNHRKPAAPESDLAWH